MNFIVQIKDHTRDLPFTRVIAQFASEKECLLFTIWYSKYFLSESIKLGFYTLYAIDIEKSLVMKTVNKDNLKFV